MSAHGRTRSGFEVLVTRITKQTIKYPIFKVA